MIHRSISSLLQVFSSRVSGNFTGILLTVFSTACMAGMYAAIRSVPGDMHPFEMAFFRNLFAMMLLIGWRWRNLSGLFATRHLGLHLLRGVLNVVAMLTFFSAVLISPLTEVAALGFTGPLFASLLAILVFKERPGWYRLMAYAAGFSGALIIVRPGLSVIQLGSILLLVSSLVWAVTILVIKVLTREDSSLTIATYMVTVMTPLSLLPALFVWQWPDPAQVAWFVVIALFGTLGQLSLTQAFRMAEITAVLPLDFLKLIWGALLGWFLFAEIPGIWTLLGGVVIFSSTTYLALKEFRPKGHKEGNHPPTPSNPRGP